MTIEQLEERLGIVLGVGTAISTVLLGIGLLLSLAGGPASVARTTLAAGLLVLIGTPVGRVAASLAAFILRRDWAMAVMTALVLGSLGVSLLIAFR